MIIEETKQAWYLIVRRLCIESAIFFSFRKYNSVSRRTLRRVALIDIFTEQGRSQAVYVDAEDINGPFLKQGSEIS